MIKPTYLFPQRRKTTTRSIVLILIEDTITQNPEEKTPKTCLYLALSSYFVEYDAKRRPSLSFSHVVAGKCALALVPA
jgi:hypothetical protein